MTLQEILPMLSMAEPRTLEVVYDVLTQKQKSPDFDEDVKSITQTEAARRLNVGRSTIGRMMRKGVFVTVHLDGTNRINLRSFLDYARGRNQGGKVVA